VYKVQIPRKRVRNFYPVFHTLDRSNISTYYAWIGDFQEYYLPHFFSASETNARKLSHRNIVKSCMPVVFSSFNAQADFDKFYPGNKNKKAVLRFASVLNQSYRTLDIVALKKKFGISGRYFIVTNQFWKHKNHMTVVEAFRKIAGLIPDVQLVLTGKESDYRNPEYPAQLKRDVKSNDPGNRILFLGFIDREEQLRLMQDAIAIVQPSLFEGWSTVVEDAKALNKFIILSSLDVHLEQMKVNREFFEPMDVESLSRKMLEASKNPPVVVPINYDDSIDTFAREFLQLFEAGRDEM
jgi:glycosyltransferase involved in cell wall biosynthesis